MPSAVERAKLARAALALNAGSNLPSLILMTDEKRLVRVYGSDVVLGGALTDHQLLCDLPIAPPIDNEGSNLPLARSQASRIC